MKGTTIGIAAVGLAAGAALAARSAAADDVHCAPNLGSVTVEGNVLIAAPCEMDGTRVAGNVRLYAGGTLLARGVAIDGNIEGRTAFDVDVAESSVGGNVELEDSVGDRVILQDTEVRGNVHVKESRAVVQLLNNEVGSNIEASRNRGGVDIFGNTVEGNLECRGNRPEPSGGNNRVRGKTEGQCRSLSPQAAPTPPDDAPDPGPDPEPAPSDEDSGETPAPTPTSGAPPPDEPGPFNPVSDNVSGGGGGSADRLTLLVLSLLAWVRRRASEGFGAP